jgi:L-histidine N-alpha-methyltransferase
MTVALRLAEPAPRTSDPLTRMTAEVRAGLLARPRSLPSKYFYDDRGSELFEAITRLPEYYQTRTEESLLAAAADELIARAQPVELLELGSGAGRKVRLLLAAMRRHGRLRRLTLFDINASSVRAAAGRARAWDAALDVREAVGDFTADLSALGPGGGRLALLFGGTIGNLHPDAVPPFLQELAAHLAAGDHFLVGVDLVKDRARLEAAYNDATSTGRWTATSTSPRSSTWPSGTPGVGGSRCGSAPRGRCAPASPRLGCASGSRRATRSAPRSAASTRGAASARACATRDS